MTDKLKNLFSFILRLGLSVGLLIFVFSKIDLQKTSEVIRAADLSNLAWAAAAFLLVNIVLLFRWFIFIKALDLEVTKKGVIFHYFYGLFGNLFLPSAIGGDIIKAVGLCKGNTNKPRVVASILIDRLSGFVAIALLALISFVFGYSLIEDKTLIIPIGLITVTSATIVSVLLIEPVYAFFCRAFDWWPKLKNGLMTMHYDIALLKQAHKMADCVKGVAIGAFSQAVLAVSYYFVAQALNQDISMVYFLIFVPIISVVSSLPSIGGLGVRELGAVYLFGTIGIASGIAVSMTLMSFFFMVMVGLIGGVLYVYTLFTGRIQHHSSDADLKAGQA